MSRITANVVDTPLITSGRTQRERGCHRRGRADTCGPGFEASHARGAR